MKKLFNLMMLLTALTIGFTACEQEEQLPPPDDPKPEAAGDYCFDIYLLDDWYKLESNEALIVEKQEAKGWIHDAEETQHYSFSAAEGDQTKVLWFVNYIHTPSSGTPFVVGYMGVQHGGLDGNEAAQKELLDTYGFTKEQVLGAQLTNGAPAAVGYHPTRDIELLMYWMPTEQDPSVDIVYFQFADSNR